MDLKHICNITGCAAVLTVSAWGQNAKADYTDAKTIKVYWQQNPGLFQTMFEELFKSEDLRLLSEALPDGFKNKKRDLYKVEIRDRKPFVGIFEGNLLQINHPSNVGFVFDGSFHTASDLDSLPYNTRFKKICKVLGSDVFLRTVLTSDTVDAVLSNACREDCDTTVVFRSYCPNKFFGTSDTGKLTMEISQASKGKEPSFCCRLDCVFEKRGTDVFLTKCDICYCSGEDTIEAYLMLKPRKASAFRASNNILLKEKLPHIFKALYKKHKDDVFRDMYEKSSSYPYFFNFPNDEIVECFFSMKEQSLFSNKVHEKRVRTLLGLLPTEEFLREVFGKEFLGMLQAAQNFGTVPVQYRVLGVKDGCTFFGCKKDPDQLKIRLVFCDSRWLTPDGIVFDLGDAKIVEFTDIELTFVFDIEKNEIRDVEFCGKLSPNGELVTRFK